MKPDFSCELPQIIDRLLFVSEALQQNNFDFGYVKMAAVVRGCGEILEGLADELEEINRGLYGPEPKEGGGKS